VIYVHILTLGFRFSDSPLLRSITSENSLARLGIGLTISIGSVTTILYGVVFIVERCNVPLDEMVNVGDSNERREDLPSRLPYLL
jgi:hypothetical protein